MLLLLMVVGGLVFGRKSGFNAYRASGCEVCDEVLVHRVDCSASTAGKSGSANSPPKVEVYLSINKQQSYRV